MVEVSRDGATDVESAGIGTIVQEELCIQRPGGSENELGYVFKGRH